MAETTLLELYNKHKKGDWPDKGSTHSYIEVYEEILAPYRHTAKNILEIGLMSGESLRMWTEYFDGKVWGMDCSETPIDGLADLGPIIKEGFPIVIGDASNMAEVENIFGYEKFMGGMSFDVVIDDAGHDLIQQLQIRQAFMRWMSPRSIYVIEDVQNIDRDGEYFTDLGGEIIDRRHIKNRYDDVLVIFKQ